MQKLHVPSTPSLAPRRKQAELKFALNENLAQMIIFTFWAALIRAYEMECTVET